MDAEYLDISECVVEWKVTRQATGPFPPWHPSDFGKAERICYDQQPDLRQVLKQARQSRMAANIPVQQITLLTLPPQEVPVFESVRDLDMQCQW